MKQQINLHQPIFRKQRALFSSEILLRVCAIWIIGLGLIYALSVWRQGSLNSALAQLEQQRDAASIRLQELITEQTDPGQSSQLAAEVKRVSSEQAQMQGIVTVLARGNLGVTTGFADQMRSLAERRTQGVWLTRIDLRRGGQNVVLEGAALHEDLLPEFLERLAGRSGEARFTGGRFSQVTLNRIDDESPIRFELRTEAPQETRR